jgi:hypothetical protein
MGNAPVKGIHEIAQLGRHNFGKDWIIARWRRPDLHVRAESVPAVGKRQQGQMLT